MTRLRLPPQSVRERIEESSARIESLESQLIEAQRLATLGTLSMSMAHEFNNLLMTIINQADTALEARGEESMRRALEKTLACGEKASTMIRNMLGFASSSAEGAPQTVRATKLMEDALGLLVRDPAKDGIKVERDHDESLLVRVQPVELTQALLNLLINARQAMTGKGGTLILGVRREDDYVALEVRDTGVGISPENMEKLFEPFFTTKQPPCSNSIVGHAAAGAAKPGAGGSGLGLYLSRKIARDHGGDVGVVSRPGQGATFTIYLPEARSE